MKQIFIFLLAIIGVAQAQFSPTSAKTAFKNGVSIGTRDSSAYVSADSLVVVINRQGRMMYRSTDGYWKILANTAASDYVPYTGAVDNVALGNFRLTARSLRTDSIYANGSGGLHLVSNSGTQVALLGAGGSSEVSFYGFAGYDANRAGSYTVRSFTDKNYVDSADALRVRYIDTATMLAPFIQYSDTTGLFSNVVRTFGTQTIGGNKTFSNDININGITVGRGAGNISTNTAFGSSALASASGLTAGTNSAFGILALNALANGTKNTAIGVQALSVANNAEENTAIGYLALAENTTGSRNIALGNQAGYGPGAVGNTTGSNNIFIGYKTQGLTRTGTNELVIGNELTGNGSNTVTIGNSSVTNNYFSGNVRGAAFIPTGGTSSQFLKADGSLDGTSYATAASISGTTNYIPKFTSSSAVGNSDLRTDASNNLGLGITPSAWSWKAMQISNTAIASTSTVGFITANTYFDTDYKYITTGAAQVLEINNGNEFRFRTAGSGTAGSNITFSTPLTIGSSLITSTVPISGTSLSMSGEGSFGGAVSFSSETRINGNDFALLSGAANSEIAINYNGKSNAPLSIYNGANLGSTPNFKFNPNGYSWLNGGRVGILTTTDNGTDALQVAGSGLFTGNITTNLPVAGGSGKLLLQSNGTRFGALGTSNWAIGSGGTDFAMLAESGNGIRLITNGSTQALTIASTGAATFSSSVTATGFIVSSDRTLKNIIKRDGDVAYYKWKDKQDDKVHIGYIAQDVQKTNPDQVSENNGKLAVNYIEILVEKVRALEKEIEQLKRKRK